MTHLQVEASPESVGMSSARLARIGSHFQSYIDDGRLPGWQITVARHGKIVHQQIAGHRDIAGGKPVEADTIWRIYSMTKPITAVLALQLWEEGAFELNDPVHAFLPAFGEVKVWRGGTVEAPELDSLTAKLSIWQLLTHTSGLTYGFMRAHPVDALYRQAGFDFGVPPGLDLQAMCDTIATLPLLFQPGTAWNYSVGFDVLGRLLEVVSGQTLDELMHTRLLEPLGMHETTWHVPEANQARLARLYGADPSTGKAVALDQIGESARQQPRFLGGGGGMQSTAYDYNRFAQMLLNGGELGGVRILSPRTVRYMVSNHLPGNVDLTTFGRPLAGTVGDGVGFGLGVSVVIDPVKAHVPGNVGDFAWGGAASTVFWVDRVDQLIVQFFTQLLPSSTLPLRSQLKQLVYQALID
ncbi:MAG: beta-lactamase family protein [Actinobacteria bacterium]|nr:beta-lactamase family protein [Actinomycetota bacterium]